MRQFIGTKIVSARPMSRAEYNVYRGWKLPGNEDGRDAGYLVEYNDGGQQNDERHQGYISWSPAEQFERAHVEIGDAAHLHPHQMRVAGELADLDARIERLAEFILASPIHNGLPSDETARLHRQLELMEQLSKVLGERIDNFVTTSPLEDR